MWSSLFVRMALCLMTDPFELTLRVSKCSKFPADSALRCDKSSVLGDAIKGAPVNETVTRASRYNFDTAASRESMTMQRGRAASM
jgi:hypothetical protein